MAPTIKRREGAVFGFLTAVRHVGKGGKWLVKCACGKEKVVCIYQAERKTRGIRSCGCELKNGISKARFKHGASTTMTKPPAALVRTYSSWKAMIARCYDRTHKDYKNYGARGISVCPRWRYSFANFLADMGERPQKTTLGRQHNSENYYQFNCGWETPRQQANNKRNTIFLTHGGETLSVSDWALRTGLNIGCIRQRVRAGYSDSAALLKPHGRGIRWENRT